METGLEMVLVVIVGPFWRFSIVLLLCSKEASHLVNGNFKTLKACLTLGGISGIQRSKGVGECRWHLDTGRLFLLPSWEDLCTPLPSSSSVFRLSFRDFVSLKIANI